MKALVIPSAALEDPNSFEILRVWAAKDEQHVSICPDLNGQADDFGYMLAQLAIHGSKLYAEKFDQPETSLLNEILMGFKKEIDNNTGNPTGGILKSQ